VRADNGGINVKNKTMRILLFSMLSLSIIAAVTLADPSMLLQPSLVEIEPDGQFTVQVQVYEVVEFFAASVELKYDASLLKAIEASAGDFLGTDVIFFDMPGDGVISMAISKKAGTVGASGSGILANVRFRAVSQGVANISVNTSKLTLTQSDGEPIPDFEKLTVVPCEVTIGVKQTELSIEPSESQVKIGNEITLKAFVSNVDRLFGVSFEIQFDGNVLEYARVSAGGFLGEDSIFLDIKGDNRASIAVSMKAGDTPASGSGEIASIIFRGKAAGESQISYRVDTANLRRDDGSSIPFMVKNGSVTVIPGMKGDVNNDGLIRSNDAILALRFSAGILDPTPSQLWAADMNEDGRVRTNDAIMILRKAAGLSEF
jgi:hypothetical protein